MWSVFTGPLGAGDEFTPAHREDLVLALDERLKAANPAWGMGDQSAVNASRLKTRRCIYTGPGPSGVLTNAASDFYSVIRYLSPSWRRPKAIEGAGGVDSAWSGEAVFVEALADLGAPGVPADYTGPLSNRGYWNMIRQAIRLLRWRPITIASGGDFYLKSVNETTFVAAKASWAAAGEALFSFDRASGYIEFNSSGSFTLTAFRRFWSAGVDIPASWGAWTCAAQLLWRAYQGLDAGQESSYAPITYRLEVGGQTLSAAGPAGGFGLGPWMLGSGVAGTGVLSVNLQPQGYVGAPAWADEADAALPWIPSGTDEVKVGGAGASISTLAARPVFVRA